MNKSNVITHPSSQRHRGEIASKFLELKKIHDAACSRMWAGTLALAFTDEELATIPDLLCPHDQALLDAIRNPQKLRKRKAK